MLIIMSGLPGTGKSTLSLLLSRKLSAAYIRIDTIEAALINLGELRLLTFGLASTGKLLVVSHTERGGSIRIISARELTKRERKSYEGG